MSESGDQDFSAQLSVIMAAKPDVLFVPNYYTEDALMARQAKELGLKVPIFASDGAETPELIQIGGEAVEGIHFIGHFHSKGAATPLSREFLKAFQEKIPQRKRGQCLSRPRGPMPILSWLTPWSGPSP